jgi:hypothetical protein
MADHIEDRISASPLESVTQLTSLPNELLDHIFGDLERPDLEAFLLNHSTRSSARLSFWRSVTKSPPTDESAENYDVQCGAYLKSLAEWCVNLADLNPDKPESLKNEVPPVLLLRRLTIALPQKEINAPLLRQQVDGLPEAEVEEGADDWLESITPELKAKVLNRRECAFTKHPDYRPDMIQKLLAAAQKLVSLVVVGFHAPTWVAPGGGMTAPWTKTHPKITLPPNIRHLTLKDIRIRGLPYEPTSAWDWEVDQFGSDVLYNFESFSNIEKLRYVVATDEVEDCFRMIRLLDGFTRIKTLRIDNVPPWIQEDPNIPSLGQNPNLGPMPNLGPNLGQIHNFIFGVVPNVGQKQVMLRLKEKLPQSCQTLDVRPRVSFDPIELWTDDWPESLPLNSIRMLGSIHAHRVRIIRLPIRNVFEALMSTTPAHQLRFEVLIASQELTEHHFSTGFTWLCPALKFLEELAFHFDVTHEERRSLVFITGTSSGDGPDPIWSPNPNPHQQWEVNARRSIQGLPTWTERLDEFVFQQAARQFPNAEQLFEFIHLHHPARGQLGVQCRTKSRRQANLEVLYDSDDSDESFGLYSDAEDEDNDDVDADADADDELYNSAGEDSD